MRITDFPILPKSEGLYRATASKIKEDQSSVQIKHIVPVFFCYFRFVFAATATNYFYKAAVDPTAMQYVHQNRPDFSATRYWAVPAVKVTGGI